MCFSYGWILFGVLGVVLLVQGIKGLRTGRMHWGKEVLEEARARRLAIFAVILGAAFIIFTGWAAWAMMNAAQ